MSAASAAPAGPVRPAPATTARPDGGAVVVDRGTVRREELRAPGWRLQGIAKVVGPVAVGRGVLRGTVTVGGPLTADELSVVGSLQGRGAISVSVRLAVHGTLDAGATVHAGEALLAGTSRLTGELTTDTSVRVQGSFRAPGVRCRTLDGDAVVSVPGVVEATSVDLRLGGGSHLGEVRGATLAVRGPRPNLVQRVLGPPPPARIDRIEAGTARLEGVRVGFVRAREITLGPDAHVAAYEGRIVRAHRTSRLGPESWSAPPAGLMR